MDARALNIVTILQNPQRFIVPVYQRTYEWTVEKQIENLYGQVEEKAQHRMSFGMPQSPHYLGAILLMPRGEQAFGTLPIFDVVDGQQRLTTIQLFLCALKNVAANVKLPFIAEQINSYIVNTTQALMQNESEERYKLYTTSFDRKIFCSIVDKSSSELHSSYSHFFYRNGNIHPDAPKPLRCFWFFKQRIEEFIGSSDDISRRLSVFASALLEDLRLIVITLGSEDDAQVIFETLNSGGEPLAAMDLVRNDVFHRAVCQGENVNKLMEDRWRIFEDDFWKKIDSQGRIKKPRIDFFLAHTLAAETGREALISELYSRYKIFVKERNFSSVDEELKLLLHNAPTYKVLAIPEGDSCLAGLARGLHAFEVSTAYPLVFIVASSQISEEEKCDIYKLIKSYIVRRALCEGMSSKNYNNTFMRICAYLRTRGVSRENFAEAFSNSDADTVRFPSDAELRNAILCHRQYNRLTQQRLKWILSELEFVSRTQFDETVGLLPNLSIEHVMPDRWYAYWPISDGTQAPADLRTGLNSDQLVEVDRREKIKHTLGNLTLLTPPANSEGLNYSYEVKRERLRTSLLRLNQNIAESTDRWDEEAIKKRAEYLADLAIKAWPYP